MNILHVGSYDRNLGDNIAMSNIRQSLFPKLTRWTSHQFDKKMSAEFVNSHTALLIGGGGLIEGGIYSNQPSGYKLPIDKKFLDKIKVPIFVCAVGLNDFRGMPSLTGKGLTNFKHLAYKAVYFSVRNDGTYEKLSHKMKMDNIVEVPDPGLVSSNIAPRQYSNSGCISVAFNSSPIIQRYRRFTISQLEQYNLDIMCHTPKDYKMKGNFVFSLKELQDNVKHLSISLLERYYDYGFSVAMRGHGQMVSIAKNIPCITLSSQDKLLEFSHKNGLMDYTVDTQDKDWQNKLKSLIERIKIDKEYRDRWYDIANSLRNQYHYDFNVMINTLEAELVNLS